MKCLPQEPARTAQLVLEPHRLAVRGWGGVGRIPQGLEHAGPSSHVLGSLRLPRLGPQASVKHYESSGFWSEVTHRDALWNAAGALWPSGTRVC